MDDGNMKKKRKRMKEKSTQREVIHLESLNGALASISPVSHNSNKIYSENKNTISIERSPQNIINPKPRTSTISSNKNKWNFENDYNDHFETPLIAYQDIFPVLQELAKSLNKSVSEVCLYDPYYCQGQMKNHLRQLGFQNIINENKDFYADIKQKKVPEYDILITNPPYSGEHKQKLLSYLANATKPFLLLLPVYIATKSYWRDFILNNNSNNNNNNNNNNSSNNNNNCNNTTATATASNIPTLIKSPPATSRPILYILPPDSYQYRHPEETGKALPPFYSCWFVGTGGSRSTANNRNNENNTNTISRINITSLQNKLLHHGTSESIAYQNRITQAVPSLITRPAPQKIVQASHANTSSIRNSSDSNKTKRIISVYDSADSLVTMGYVQEKRPNPKRRKKMKLNASI